MTFDSAIMDKQNMLSDVISIIERKSGGVWGLSYGSDNQIKWQFEIKSHVGLIFEIITYSWLTGEAHSKETVTSRFLCDECDIFFSRQSFMRAAARGAMGPLSHMGELAPWAEV